jgi:hypothetical protein
MVSFDFTSSKQQLQDNLTLNILQKHVIVLSVVAVCYMTEGRWFETR